MRETLYPAILRVKVDDELRKALIALARRQHLGTSTLVRSILRRAARDAAIEPEAPRRKERADV